MKGNYHEVLRELEKSEVMKQKNRKKEKKFGIKLISTGLGLFGKSEKYSWIKKYSSKKARDSAYKHFAEKERHWYQSVERVNL